MTTADRLTKWAGRSLIAICLVHMLILGIDAMPWLPEWSRLQLWSMEHWEPAAQFEPALLLSSHAFWSTLGSFALPMIVVGAWLSSSAAEGSRVPAFVGWGLGAWVLLCSLVIEPSGFPLGMIPACLLIAADRRRQASATAVPMVRTEN